MFTFTVLVLLIAFVIVLFNESSHSTFLSSRNVLLVTAHPDDECFFFAPTLLALRQGRNSRALTPELFSLCLSTGDAGGFGETRIEELGRSLDVLGVEKARRWVVDNSELKDNITAYWNPLAIAEAVRPYVVENRITTILTFDHGGITGHPNHASLPTGIAHLLASWSENSQARPQLYTLLTSAFPSNCLGPLAPLRAKADMQLTRIRDTVYSQVHHMLGYDIPITKSDPDVPVLVAGVKEYLTAIQAIRQHKSELVWSHWLYALLSRYMWVNEWVEVKVQGDGESVVL